MTWAKQPIQDALNELPYDAFVEEIAQKEPRVFDVTVSYDKSDRRGRETVILDPATETFSVQQS
jgi:YD repeat-containing protein